MGFTVKKCERVHPYDRIEDDNDGGWADGRRAKKSSLTFMVKSAKAPFLQRVVGASTTRNAHVQGPHTKVMYARPPEPTHYTPSFARNTGPPTYLSAPN